MLQGLSVLAMVCLHLFDRNYEGLYQPLIFFKGIPLSFYLGQLSDFCVFGFAFCSGYAHMSMFEQNNYYKRRIHSLLPLLINYWLVIAVFSIISLCTGQANFMPGSFSDFLGTVFLYDVHYNGAWWYMWAYILLVLISPLLLKATKVLHPALVLCFGFAVYCAAFYVRFFVTTDNYFLQRFGPFGMTLFEYLVGCVVYKIKLTTRIKKIWIKIPVVVRWVGTVIILLSLLIGHTLVVPSLFIAPATGLIIVSLFSCWCKPKPLEKAFLFIGKHSTNIWLTHMFFYLVVFKDFVYIAKYPILIYALMIIITLAISVLLQWIQKPILKLLSKKRFI